MSRAEQDEISDALDDLGRAQSLAALLRWALSHRDPPEGEAFGGLYIVACDAECGMDAVAAKLRGLMPQPDVRRGTP